MKEKKKKDKLHYSALSDIAFSFKWTHKMSRGKIGSDMLVESLKLLQTIYDTYLGKLVLDVLAQNDTVSHIVLKIAGICLLPILIYTIRTVSVLMGYRLYAAVYDKNTAAHAMKVQCDADYEMMENPEHKTLFSQYWDYCCDAKNAFSAARDFAFDIIKVIIFGTLLSTLNPIIFIALAVIAVLRYISKKPLTRLQHKTEMMLTENTRRFNYSTRISSDYENAKEVRIYGMSGWLNSINDELTAVHRKIQGKIQNKAIEIGFFHNLLNAARDAAAYIFLIMLFAEGSMTPGNFVLYFSAITSISQTLNGFADKLADIDKKILRVDTMREMHDRHLTNKNRGIGIPVPTSAPAIEFRNVSYKYPGAADFTLKNVSFTINAGEKMAIVGVNGAGKTTLIKLMCGLYTPTEGEIYVDGHNAAEYNINDYYSVFSAVFQEVNLIPYSIAEHVAATTDTDKINRAAVYDAIERAGLRDKIDGLENGIDTLLCKDINKGGIELSGGEAQKLALARAIYLARPVLILDEPTSALDAIAENEMYMRFDVNTKNKTAVFISHRLASTHFCDRIITLDGGRIAEIGTHDELIKNGGKYKQMYDIQRSYYKDGREAADEE